MKDFEFPIIEIEEIIDTDVILTSTFGDSVAGEESVDF